MLELEASLLRAGLGVSPWRKRDKLARRMPARLTPELARCLALLGELGAIGRALDAAGVEHAVLKGLPLAVRLTGRIDGRQRRIRDADILVRRQDAQRAVDALNGLGYSALPGLTLASQLETNFELEMYRRSGEGMTLCAEVHWAPFPPLLYPVDETYIWARMETVVVGERPVRVLDRPLTILQLASHFVQHAASVDWVLGDLAAAWNLWGDSIDPGNLRSAAERTGLRHVLAFSLAVAHERGLLHRAPPPISSNRARLLRMILPVSRLGPPQALPTVRRSLQLSVLAPARRIPVWLWSRVAPPRALMAAHVGLHDAERVRPHHYAVRYLRALKRAAERLRGPADR